MHYNLAIVHVRQVIQKKLHIQILNVSHGMLQELANSQVYRDQKKIDTFGNVPYYLEIYLSEGIKCVSFEPL